jgi:hypothetical protein
VPMARGPPPRKASSVGPVPPVKPLFRLAMRKRTRGASQVARSDVVRSRHVALDSIRARKALEVAAFDAGFLPCHLGADRSAHRARPGEIVTYATV